MHKSLDCSGFPPAYAHLGALTTIDASRLALARALIALGPSHRSHTLTGPFWWSIRGVSTVFSLLSSKLHPTPGFWGQSASYRKSDAFLLAEALTYWFAQTHLKARIVVPLEAHLGGLVKTGPAAAYPKTMPKYFRNAVTLGPKAEPDFLAFSAAGDVHVLESKGRAGFGPYGLDDSEVNKARNKGLRQVCKVATVNGHAPVTRTVCVYAFDQGGLRGQITDPPAVQPMDYRAEPVSLIRQAYRCVLDPVFVSGARPIDLEHVGLEFAEGWWFGIHRDVYDRLRKLDGPDSALEFLGFLDDFADERLEIDESLSAGPEGFILIGKPDRKMDHAFRYIE